MNKRFKKFVNIINSATSKKDIVICVGNTCTVYGTYRIVQEEEEFHIYKNSTHISSVSHYSTALAWCVADKFKRNYLTKDILKFNKQLNSKWFEIENYKSLVKSPSVDKERKEILLVKLSQDVIKYQKVRTELQNCVKKAKYIKQ